MIAMRLASDQRVKDDKSPHPPVLVPPIRSNTSHGFTGGSLLSSTLEKTHDLFYLESAGRRKILYPVCGKTAHPFSDCHRLDKIL
jgi:hypothetical protein